jgi:protein TonB
MKTLPRISLSIASLAILLAACGHERTSPAPAPARTLAHRGATAPAPAPAPALLPGQRVNYDHIDRYKEDVAELIVSRNNGHTFSGQLPPMLPAIVVLRVTVNADGRVTEAFVQRSRDKEASNVAMASLQRVGQLPRPQNLVRAPARSLSFSETFLFNADYKFQLRSLAGPQ